MAKLANLKVVIGLSKSGLRKLNQDIKITKGKFRSNFGEITSIVRNAAAMIGGAMVGAVTAMVKSAADLERVETSFRSIMGGADGAARMMGKLNKFAASTPYQIEEVATAARQLLAVGTSERALPDVLRTVGDIAAANGSSITEMSAIYAKAQAKGKIDQEILNQLLDRGINIKAELIKVTGQAADEFEASSVSLGDFNQALKNMASEGGSAHGAMANLSTTTYGLASTLMDVSKQALSQFAEDSGIARAAQTALALQIANVGRTIRTTKGEVDDLSTEFQRLVEKGMHPNVKEGAELEDEFSSLEEALNKALKKADEGSDEYQRLSSMLDGVAYETVKLNEATLAGLPPAEQTTEEAKLSREAFEAQYEAAKQLREEKERLADATRQVIVTSEDERASAAAMMALGGGPMSGEIAEITIDEEQEVYEPHVEALSEMGERLQHVNEERKRFIALAQESAVAEGQLALTISNQLGSAFQDIITGAADAGDAFARFAAEAIKASLAAAQAGMIESAITSGKMSGPAAFFVIPTMVAAGMALVDSFFGQIPAMAAGGLFTGASLALVGEGVGTSAANPEVVAPLDKLRGMLGGQSVQVTGVVRGGDILLTSERALIDRNRLRSF